MPRPVQSVDCAGSDIPIRNRRGHPPMRQQSPCLRAAAWRRRIHRFPAFANVGAAPKWTPRRSGSNPATRPALAMCRNPSQPTSRRGSPPAASANAVHHIRLASPQPSPAQALAGPRYILRSQIVRQTPSVLDFPDYRKDSFQISSFPPIAQPILDGPFVSPGRPAPFSSPQTFLARAENSSGHAVWPAVRSGEQPARAGKTCAERLSHHSKRCLITHDSRYRISSYPATISI